MNGKRSGAGETVGVTQICKLEREVIALAQADEKTSTVQGNTAKVEAGRGAVKAGCGAGPCVGFPSPRAGGREGAEGWEVSLGQCQAHSGFLRLLLPGPYYLLRQLGVV